MKNGTVVPPCVKFDVEILSAVNLKNRNKNKGSNLLSTKESLRPQNLKYRIWIPQNNGLWHWYLSLCPLDTLQVFTSATNAAE